MEKKKTTKTGWWQRVTKWIGTDGLLHFFACAFIAFAAGIPTNPAIGFIIALAVGVLKEIVWDAKLKKGTFEWKDILFDFLGGVAAFGLMMI